jgi:hypothetical protein
MPLASIPGPDGLNAYPPHAACRACSLPVDWTRKLFYAPDAHGGCHRNLKPGLRPYSDVLTGEWPFRYRGEFRAPFGVRKSPRNEPAVQRLWLWGFGIFGKHGGAGLAPDGGSWVWFLPGYSTSLAQTLAQCGAIYGAMSEAGGHGQGRWPHEREERCRPWQNCQDVGWVQAVPGHDTHLPADPGVGGGALG